MHIVEQSHRYWKTMSGFSKILFPTDFSPASTDALSWATSLARDTGATMTIIHVEEPPMAYGGGELYLDVQENDREDLRKALVNVLPLDHDVPFEHKLLVGEPATAIVETAENEQDRKSVV